MSSIMSFTGMALKNLFSKPATTKYPEKPKVYPERTRGHVEIKIEDCILCGLCMRNCPPRAIKVDRAASTWEIMRFDCIQCGYCVQGCPKKCLSIVPGYTEPQMTKEAEVHTKPAVPKPAAAPAAANTPQAAKTAPAANIQQAEKPEPAAKAQQTGGETNA